MVYLTPILREWLTLSLVSALAMLVLASCFLFWATPSSMSRTAQSQPRDGIFRNLRWSLPGTYIIARRGTDAKTGTEENNKMDQFSYMAKRTARKCIKYESKKTCDCQSKKRFCQDSVPVSKWRLAMIVGIHPWTLWSKTPRKANGGMRNTVFDIITPSKVYVIQSLSLTLFYEGAWLCLISSSQTIFIPSDDAREDCSFVPSLRDDNLIGVTDK